MQRGLRLAALCCAVGLAVPGMSFNTAAREAGLVAPEEQATVRASEPVISPSKLLRTGGPSGGGPKVVADRQRVYVSGPLPNSSGNTDFTTIQYSSKGKQGWVRRYNGPAGGEDVPQGMAVDGSGNSYVTGSSAGGSGPTDFATVKYAPDGRQEWVRRYNGPAKDYDFPVGVGVDNSGSVYVAGDAGVSENRWDYTTIRYSPAGKEVWNKRYNGPYQGSSSPAALYVDPSGYLYVTGHSQSGENTYDFATVCYTKTGHLDWVSRYARPDSNYNFPVGLVESGGSVYVAGSTRTKSGNTSYTVVKYNRKSGKRAWARHYNSGQGDDDPSAIAAGKNGSVYVTGTSGRGKFQTIKFNRSGDIGWTRSYTETIDYDRPTAMCSDDAGNVYVTGESQGDGSGSDYLTIKYTPGGKVLWVRRFNGAGNGDDTPTDIAVDQDGYTYVTGWSESSQGKNTFATIRYNPNGGQSWVRYFP